jgi:uncharacterized membrane protein YuzA (DUF378 family)
MVNGLLETLKYAVMGIAGLLVLYLAIRIFSSAVFRSYFDARHSFITKFKRKGGKQ